jgi:hypothetical protein
MSLPYRVPPPNSNSMRLDRKRSTRCSMSVQVYAMSAIVRTTSAQAAACQCDLQTRSPRSALVLGL